MTMQYVNADVSQLVRLIASHFSVLSQEREIDFTVDADTTITAQIDPDKLSRIVLNLLSNAFKFTPDHGSVTISVRQINRQIRIQVQDSGPGIPVDKQETIFEAFRQLDGGISRRFGGTGLGLSIAKQFAELHYGTITVTNKPDSGALFTVTIPTIAPAGVPVSYEHLTDQLDVVGKQAVHELSCSPAYFPPEAQAASLQCAILVVEDNTDMNAFICSVLQQHYRVLSAFNGAEGLQLAVQNTPDLIVCDIMMPVMSGDEMVREIRRQPKLQNTPVIMLTAKADDELQIEMLSTLVHDYLRKPFLPDELLARIAGTLAERAAALRKLQASEERFRAIVETSPVAYAMNDRHLNVTLLNTTFTKTFGYTIEDIPTLNDWWAKAYPDPQYCQWVAATWQEHLRKSHEEGRPVEPVEATICCKDGTSRTVLVNAAVLGEGDVEEVLAILYDITERKMVEQELRRAMAATEAANLELKSSNADLEQIAYVASHDLRSPLRAIENLSEWLEQDLEGTLPPESAKHLQLLRGRTRRMEALLDALMKYSRAGRIKAAINTVNTAEMISEIANSLDVSERFTLSLGNLPRLTTATIPLQQVIYNLIDNAMKHHDMEHGTITVTSVCRGDFVEFSVADDGPGIPEQFREKVFVMFQTLKPRDEVEGSGVGLALVRKWVEYYGGSVRICSALPRGTEIKFTWPITMREDTLDYGA